MTQISNIAIPIIRAQVGIFGLGAVMPYFQWYAAWGVRIASAFTFTALFHLIQKVVIYVAGFITNHHRATQNIDQHVTTTEPLRSKEKI